MAAADIQLLMHYAIYAGMAGGAMGALLLQAVAAALHWGMGRRPMVDSCRATYPVPPGGGCPARRDAHASGLGDSSGAAGRWDKHGADPRPAAQAGPAAHSRLRDNVPQALPSGALGAGGGDSGDMRRISEELTPRPPYLAPALVLGAGGDDSGGKHGFPEELAPLPPRLASVATGESSVGKHGFPEDFVDTAPTALPAGPACLSTPTGGQTACAASRPVCRPGPPPW